VKNLQRENPSCARSCSAILVEDVIGKSARMREILRLSTKCPAAQHGAIRGKRHRKEISPRHHNIGDRAAKPFVTSVRALEETCSRASCSAARREGGKFELRRGHLFLDEIGASRPNSSDLLRVLEDRSFYRVARRGSRVGAGDRRTRVNLKKPWAGTFRDDLFYAECDRDPSAAAARAPRGRSAAGAAFPGTAVARTGKDVRGSRDALRLLMDHDCGQRHELENAVERAMVPARKDPREEDFAFCRAAVAEVSRVSAGNEPAGDEKHWSP